MSQAALRGAETPPSFFELPVNNARDEIVRNVRTNYARGFPILRQHNWTDRPLLIVGGGPSLKDFLPALRAMRLGADVLSINGAYKHLKGLGIHSDYFLLLDSRPENRVHVESPTEGTEHILATQVDPVCISDLAGYPVTLYNIYTEACVEALEDFPDPKSYVTAPIGMSSVHAVYVAAALGYRKQFLFGYDMSVPDDHLYAYEQALDGRKDYFEVDLNGKKFRTTYAMARTAEQFQKAISPVIRSSNLDIRIMCGGLLPALIQEQAKVHTAETEKLKYEQIWAVENYRKVSPALRHVKEAVELLEIPEGASIVDLGCGTGRATQWFSDHGFKAIGVDITKTAVEEPIDLYECALWEGGWPEVDYGFSVDVMEHIPPAHVDETLQRIYDSCRVGCYLNIDTLPDAFGLTIGKPLHLSLMPAEQWAEKLRKLWGRVEVSEARNKQQAIFTCWRK